MHTIISCNFSRMAPGETKVNFYRLLRQLESSKDQWDFLRVHKLVPSTIDCEKCYKTLSKIYPLSNPDAPFKYFNCKCSKKLKVPITKNTLMFHSNISPRTFLILAYGFAYRWKYSDIRREADVEGLDNHWLNITIWPDDIYWYFGLALSLGIKSKSVMVEEKINFEHCPLLFRQKLNCSTKISLKQPKGAHFFTF